ncbi:mitochondrial carrier domain-containing protein [Haematococcus lacustris]
MSTQALGTKAAMESVQPAAAAAHANAAPALAAAAAASSVFVFLPKSVLTELLTSGISVGCANTATNPLDVVKVRLQLASNAAQASGVKPPGMVATGLSVLRNEGVTALWSGLGPSLARGFFFGGARLGLYTPIKSAIMGGNSSSASFELKVLSGSLSGGLAAAVTSPIELVKTRLQAAGKTPGAQKTSMGVIRAVMAADGVAGLWKGAMPGLFRSAILTASQCATYDEVKRGVLNYTGWSDGTHTHFTSSMIAGLVTTTITNPLDVIKTRMFVSGGRYKGALECASHVLKTEGPIGFMKGWSASYARLGPHTVIMFLTAERLRKYAGLQSL